VLRARVTSEDVLAYHDDMGEQEFICKPRRPTREKLAPDEIRDRAKRHAKRMRAQDKANGG
jgi:hypothetical protein